MLKILKYLKKYSMLIVFIFVLLFLQAFADLSLPEYTSNIVDVGIGQGGIESSVPSVIRKEQFDKLIMGMEQADRDKFISSYKLLSKDNLNSAEFETYKEQYPKLKSEDLYLLNVTEDEKLKSLNDIIIKIFSSFEQSVTPEMAEQIAIASVKQEYEEIGLDMEKMQSKYIFVSGAKMLGVAILASVFSVLVGYFSARISAGLGKDLRSKVFKKVVKFSSAEFDKYSTASLITRSTNDIQQVQMIIVMIFRIIFYSPILAIGGVIKVLNTNTSMAWIIALAVTIIMILVVTLFKIAMPKFKSMQRLVDRLNLVTREILTGLPVIRAFSKERQEEKRFDDANRDLTKTNLFVNRVMTFMMPIMMFIMNGITVLIIWKGAEGVDMGNMQVGDLMAFIQYAMQIIMSFLMISMISIFLPRASVSAARIVEVIDTDLTIHDPEKENEFLDDKKGYLEFENVSFRYANANEDVISNISFTAKPGETTAIIGSTGSGKSTLVQLIPRFFDVTQGSIKVDGVDIRTVSQRNLRNKLGYVPQKGLLFSGTVESNLKFGKQDASDAELDRATKIAQAYDFVQELPETYDSPIAQGGDNVSGGQKQRLSIARAIVKDPEIYIFDDSFSALDYKTDKQLRNDLKTQISDSTVLIVAQRISTIKNAEQIIVLDEGRIVGKGTHKELLDNCEVYHQIASSQLSEEELANG